MKQSEFFKQRNFTNSLIGGMNSARKPPIISGIPSVKIHVPLISNRWFSTNKESAALAVRISLAFVFLWFGLNQLFAPESFVGYLPQWVMPHQGGMMGPMMMHVYNANFQVSYFVILNGIFDSLIGFLLLIGLYTRIAALVAALHLLFIAFSLGYNDIAIRDVGLAIAAFSLVFSGAGKLRKCYK